MYGTDETAMHYAWLHNYLGVPDTHGSTFQEIARAQVTEQGATLVDAQITAVRATGDGFVGSTEQDEDAVAADYVMIAGGKASAKLAASLGVDTSGEGIDTDRDGRTDVDKVYVLGRVAKPNRSQAIVSAGIGAAAALDILSREAGEDVHDWDSPPKDDG